MGRIRFPAFVEKPAYPFPKRWLAVDWTCSETSQFFLKSVEFAAHDGKFPVFPGKLFEKNYGKHG
jgi:hypothetical protein